MECGDCRPGLEKDEGNKGESAERKDPSGSAVRVMHVRAPHHVSRRDSQSTAGVLVSSASDLSIAAVPVVSVEPLDAREAHPLVDRGGQGKSAPPFRAGLQGNEAINDSSTPRVQSPVD